MMELMAENSATSTVEVRPNIIVYGFSYAASGVYRKSAYCVFLCYLLSRPASQLSIATPVELTRALPTSGRTEYEDVTALHY
jgi:hypothetical protein